MRVGCWCLLFCLLGLAPAGAEVVALAAAPLPVLDGQLDDPCWQTGEWSSGFTVLGQVTTPANPQTAFKVRHGGGRVWFGIRLDEPQMDALKTTVTAHDGPVHHDDCVEIMIDPTGQNVEYFHLIINAAGTVYDAQMRQGGQVTTKAWNGDLEVKTARGEQGWTVELALPLADLGLSADSLGEWGLNVARERMAGGRADLSTFAPLAGGFHQPSRFPRLQLPDAELHPFLWAVREPYDQKVIDTGDGLAWEATTYLTNETGAFRFLVLEAELALPDGTVTRQSLTRGLDAGQGLTVPLQLPVPEPGAGLVTCRLRDRATGEAWAVHQTPVTLNYTPLAITLTQPKYRQTIYATMNLTEVAGVVACQLTPAQRQGGSLTVHLQAGERQLAATTAVREPGDQTGFRLPVADLAVGDYQLEAVLQVGDKRYTATLPLHKVPPVPHEVRIDDDQVVRVNGQPYLAFGWFSLSPADYAAARAAGINTLVDYGAHWRSLPDQLAYLDAVAAAGLTSVGYPYPNPKMVETARWAEPLSDEDAAAIRERVLALRDHPGILAWYLADEPELRPALPARLERIREVIAEADPYHPCVMLNDTIAGIHQFAGGGEILMPDPYPLFTRGGGPAQDMAKTSGFMAAVQEASDGWRAAWVTPQGFNYGDYGRLNNRVPNLTELRNQWHQAIIHRATGCLWYTYTQQSNYPELSLGIGFLAAESRLLEPWILAVATARRLDPTPADSGLQADWRETPDGVCIFAVNTSGEAREATLTLPAGAPESWQLVSEGQSLKAVDGRLTVPFAPWATHVLTSSAALAGQLSLADVEARIAAANAARNKPGNLAFEDHGTSVTVSSKSTYGSTPDRVLDGVLGGMGWRDGTPKQFPDWLSVTFAEPTTIGQVVVYSKDLSTGTLEAADGEAWVPLGELRRIDDEHLEATFPGRALSAFRVVVTGSTGPTVYITEVEAYAP